MPGAERAKYLYRIARIIQERSRELAVLESLDNGKPIRESRDVDVPLAAAHFFYYAGWADKLDYAGFGPDPRPLGVAGQVIPWNFPLDDGGLEARTGARGGQHLRAQAGLDDAAVSALLLAEIIQQADLPPGVVNVLTGAGSVAGAALVAHPGIDKVAFTGSTEIGKDLQRALAGTRQAPDPRARRQGGQHRLRGRPGRPGDRGHRERHLLQPGRGLLRRFAPCWCKSRSRTSSSRS